MAVSESFKLGLAGGLTSSGQDHALGLPVAEGIETPGHWDNFVNIRAEAAGGDDPSIQHVPGSVELMTLRA